MGGCWGGMQPIGRRAGRGEGSAAAPGEVIKAGAGLRAQVKGRVARPPPRDPATLLGAKPKGFLSPTAEGAQRERGALPAMPRRAGHS